jgi:outer membrane protein assembly factor BamA
VPFFSRRFALALALATAHFGVACASIPRKHEAIDSVTMQGTDEVSDDEIEEKIATTASPKFLGLFRGVVYDYEIYDRSTLQRDLARIERYYRARGYYDAHARAARVFRVGKNHVRVVIAVEEGVPILVGRVRVGGIDALPEPLRREVRVAARRPLVADTPFEEEHLDASVAAVERTLQDNGYAHAKVTRDVAVDMVSRRATATLEVESGAPAVFGRVRIVGLGDIPERPVRRALDITEGEPYSRSALEAARQAVLDLGVFSSAELDPVFDEPGTPPRTVPLVLRVEPTKLRLVRLGGGIEFDAIKTDVHALVGWENYNLFGGLRSYTISIRPGLVFYPIRIGNFVELERVLPEVRVRNEFRQPGFLEARTNALIRPELNVFSLLLPSSAPSTDTIPGYLEFKVSAGLDRVFWKLYGSLTHNVQVETPFAYRGERDPALGTLVLSFPELVTNLNATDDRIKPRKGVYLGNSLQVAGGPFGGDATDVRLKPDLRGYVPLGRRVTLVARASVGLLFPMNYGSSLDDDVATQRTNSPDRIRDLQVVYFRGFLAGGPNSNRGYPLRSIGPYQIVASPAFGGSTSIAACAVATASSAECRIPVGGTTLWEGSVEVRFSIVGPVSMATFCDSADVAPTVLDFRFSHPHFSCGVGGRYDTPVGPIRLDVGYRIPGLQVIGPVDPSEQQPKPIFGLPIAIAFGIGEAY